VGDDVVGDDVGLFVGVCAFIMEIDDDREESRRM